MIEEWQPDPLVPEEFPKDREVDISLVVTGYVLILAMHKIIILTPRWVAMILESISTHRAAVIMGVICENG